MASILIVDNHLENRHSLETLLAVNGYAVVNSANGLEARMIASRDPPSLVIADIQMPVMDGHTLCRQWKADERLKNIPFVFYTATYSDPKDKEFALGLGADLFIVKPQDPAVFLRLIRETLSASDAGKLIPTGEPDPGATISLEKYYQVLIRKLESKIMELETIHVELEQGVAARKQEEAAMQGSLQFIQASLDILPLAVSILNATGRVMLGNSLWQQLLRDTGLPQRKGWIGFDFLASWETVVTEEKLGPSQSLTKIIGELLGSHKRSFRKKLSWAYPDRKGLFLVSGWPFILNDNAFFTLTFEDMTGLEQGQ